MRKTGNLEGWMDKTADALTVAELVEKKLEISVGRKKAKKQIINGWREVADVPLSVAAAAEERVKNTVKSAKETVKNAATEMMNEETPKSKRYLLIGISLVILGGIGYGAYKIVNYQSGEKTTHLLGLSYLGLN